MKINHCIFGLVLMVSLTANAQDNAQDGADYYSLSLEELMNIPINSASKKDETLFDAPLSSYTITKGEIDKSGATSIMEALRLAPGVIVREQANGVYDIHIRGFDNLLRNSQAYAKSNLATLVMIDNRPVFNHNLGGTFWEALPIDLNDVDRIEIVRGPSAPLFGPNAVTGVINIITKKASNGTYANASVQYGTPNTLIANGSFGKKVNESLSFGVSINHQTREKFDNKYYVGSAKDFMTLDQIFGSDQPESFPNAQTSLEKTGANAYVAYAANQNISFDFSTGLQTAEAQKIFIGGVNTYFSTGSAETQYANLNGKIHGLTFRTSYLNGKDDLRYNEIPNKYDYKIADIEGEYTIKLGEKASIVPGVSYQNVAYDDTNYVQDGITFLNGTEQTISTLAGFIRTDFSPIKNLRVIAALRADKFSSPNDVYLAYEFATTYKLNEKNLLRGAITRSNSGSFIAYNYLNINVPNAGGPGVDFIRRGNQNADLFTVNMIELGFRSQLSKSIQMDIDVFSQQAESLTAVIAKGPLLQELENIPTTASQIGGTISFNFVPNEKWQIKPFVTLQKTETEDLPSSFRDSSIDPTLTYSTSTHKNTPSVFGGYYVSYQATSKLNVNLNGYFFGKQTQYDPNYTDVAGSISSKFLVNAKVAYSVTPVFSLFANGRNILNSTSREFFAGDQTKGLYMLGAAFKLK